MKITLKEMLKKIKEVDRENNCLWTDEKYKSLDDVMIIRIYDEYYGLEDSSITSIELIK